MPTFFTSSPGQVVQCDAPVEEAVLPIILDKAKTELTLAQRKCLVTRVTISAQTNAQFLHTLGGDIYIYVFGDRMGALSISGLCFAGNCGNNDDQHGVEHVYEWYQANKLSKRKDAISMLLGTKTHIRAFLNDFNADVTNINTMPGVMAFRLDLSLLPEVE